MVKDTDVIDVTVRVLIDTPEASEDRRPKLKILHGIEYSFFFLSTEFPVVPLFGVATSASEWMGDYATSFQAVGYVI